MTTHYHVGFNMPGYLPEAEPFTTFDFENARESMIADIERHIDETEGDDGVDQRLAAIDDLREAKTGDWSYNVGDLAYWIAQCESDDQEEEEERHQFLLEENADRELGEMQEELT